MFDIFDLFLSLHIHILRFLCTCLYPHIPASSHLYPYFCVYLLVPSHPYMLISSGSYTLARILHSRILRFVCTCLYPCILTSSYPQVHKCQLLYSHPCILISSDSWVLACVLASSHPHLLRFMCACWYPPILTLSYPQAHVYLLVSSHRHILLSSVFCVLASMLTSSDQRVLDTNELIGLSHLQVHQFSVIV